MKVQEWFDRAAKFDETAKNVKKMSNRLNKVKNRSLLYDIYPYVWDMHGVISLLNSYVKWLGTGSNLVHPVGLKGSITPASRALFVVWLELQCCRYTSFKAHLFFF